MRYVAAAIGLAAAVLLQTLPSFAGVEAYCNAFARDLADRKVRGNASQLVTSLEATGETLTDDDKKIDASATGGSPEYRSEARRWRRAYLTVLEDCMQQYASEPPKASERRRVRQPGTKAIDATCRSRHPSFDPKTGMYKTVSGKLRRCPS